MDIRVNLNYSGVDEEAIKNRRDAAAEKLRALWSGEMDYTGWVDYPVRCSEEEIRRLEETADGICGNSEVFLVLGAGGSFMGAKAVIDLLQSPDSDMEVIFAGYNFSARYVMEIMRRIGDRDVSLCVISKSGTTMETLTAYSIFEKWMKERYGSEAVSRTYVITGEESNYLRSKAEEEGISCFSLEKNIGGRYSVFSPVGLLPIAVAGISVREFLNGGKALAKAEAFEGDALDYAIARQELYARGRNVEVFESFDPYFNYFGEWLKQLFGESEGKEGKGILPYTLIFSRDLHSMGQFLQQGHPCFFETLFTLSEEGTGAAMDYPIPETALDYLVGKTLNQINKCAERGVFDAHVKAGIPVIEISMPSQDAYHVGMLMYFFEVQCAVSALLAEVCPFDQPGVEAYKRETRAHIRELAE